MGDLIDERRLSELLALLYEPLVEETSLARKAVWLLGHLTDTGDNLGMGGTLSLMGMVWASYQFLSRHDGRQGGIAIRQERSNMARRQVRLVLVLLFFRLPFRIVWL